MDLSLILNRLSVLEARVAALENPEPQRDGDQESTPSADATKPKAVAEAVNPFLQRHPRATQKQPDPLELKPKPPPAASPTPQQPAMAMQPDQPLIVNPTPTAASPVAMAIQQEVQSWSSTMPSPTPAQANPVPPVSPPRAQTRGDDQTRQVRQWREDMAPVEAAKQAWRPATELQEAEPRDSHLRDVAGQDFPQYETDVPDRDLGVAHQAVNREARDATMAERQRRVQENAVERQTRRRERIQQGRDGLSADERTPEETFNEALEVARKRSSLQGEARQRFDRQQQRQQQASGFDPWQAFEGTNQFVPPRAHEAIQTRPGRETDGLPHETFGKTVVDATKASTRAMERLSGELGEALARIEQIERDIEMRGHA